MRLTVLTVPDFAPGYRLAGTATLARSSTAEAEVTLRELIRDGVEGVIAVHQPFLDALPTDLTDEFERLDSALVVGLPDGGLAAGGEGRHARLMRMLRQAVGYEMTFESEEGGPS